MGLGRLLAELDLLEKMRREGLSPEERAAEDRAERRYLLWSTSAAILMTLGSLLLFAAPWLVGAWVVLRWIFRRIGVT